MLQDRHFQLDGPPHDPIKFRPVAVHGYPQLHADQRPMADAAVHLCQALLHILGVEVDEPQYPLGRMGDGLEDVVVLSAEFSRVGIIVPVRSHEDHQTLDSHAIGNCEHLVDALWHGSGETGEMRVRVPNGGSAAIARPGRLGG
jgi:hypothetical protein